MLPEVIYAGSAAYDVKMPKGTVARFDTIEVWNIDYGNGVKVFDVPATYGDHSVPGNKVRIEQANDADFDTLSVFENPSIVRVVGKCKF